MDLEGRVILVTGGAQGIGQATAQLAASRGALLVIADVNAEGGEETASAIRQAHGECWFHRVDVRDEGEVRTLFSEVERRHGRLDGLVCAAGVLRGAYLQPEELTAEVFNFVMEVNVRGSFLCAKHATPLLAARGHGVMVLVASGAGVILPSSSLAYGASKGGVNGLGMTLAARLAPRGIRVNVLCPGNIVTDMKLSVVAAEAELAGRPVDEELARAREEMGSPEGVARVIGFLVSDEADYVRGTLFTR